MARLVDLLIIIFSLRQTLAFSVSLPEFTQVEVAMDFMGSEYLFVSVPWMLDVCEDSEFVFYKTGDTEKREKVIEILKATEQTPKAKTLIFIEVCQQSVH